MEKIRKIKKIILGEDAMDGAGVHLVRVFGHGDTQDLDPFLMMDAFDSTNPDDYIKGFPWHPHRGIETITYLVEGEIDHGDSLGNQGIIGAGDCQWMTAGSGIIHQEMPQTSPRLFGAQIWLNLPAKNKMTPPKYRDIKATQIPVIKEEKSEIKIIAGTYQQTKGAMSSDHSDALYLDVCLEARTDWEFVLPSENTLFVYILSGAGKFEEEHEELIFEKHAILFEQGEKFKVTSGKSGLRFLLLSGKPLKDPIAWGGPIVMNTQEELDEAFEELQKGTFIKK
jgi:redox-sensitive bicupin YhaK (pirin superfamily)